MISSSFAMSSMKGHLRCFLCRTSCPVKKGDWHDHESQQVFLCKSCGDAGLKAGPKSPATVE
jgi:transposase-like protein